MAGLRTAIPATCSTVTVRSLSVSRYVGTAPTARNAASIAANTLGVVLSSSGTTTRNRHHANQKQNKIVEAPPIRGPSPKSYCAHIPGSGIHGRCTRARPDRHAFLISATARRVVRSDPLNPIAVILSCATSARILPLDRSTSSLSLGRNSSITLGRRAARPGTNVPASRWATQFATVFGEHPASSAASR